jgi:hypothetical protein
MTLSENELMVEIGSEAYSELTDREITAILNMFSSSQVKLAGMKSFELLMKKFQPTYRMGRMYEQLSAKFDAYAKIYSWYTQRMGSGKIAKTTGTERNIERYKWNQWTQDTQDELDAAD